MLWVGIDWSERWHDVAFMVDSGEVLNSFRIEDSPAGLTRLQALVAKLNVEPAEVVIGIETPHGLMPQALRAAGYTIYAVNPLEASRYRDRHRVSKAKSDRSDAKMLADLVRTDRKNHRTLPDDSAEAAAVKVLARSHRSLIWTRQQLCNQLRSTLREFYPGALAAFDDRLYEAEALALLQRAPTPAQGRLLTLSRIASALRQARRRQVESRARDIQKALRAPRLEQPEPVAKAYGAAVVGVMGTIRELNLQIETLERELQRSFEGHPDAAIYLSQPGLGLVLGARALGEFGDDPNQFKDSRARKNYASTSPITRASGTRKVVVARFARNDRLADVCDRWAFCALHSSPGARRYYDALRGRHKDNHAALRALGNRLVGILDGCLRRRQLYQEEIAWPALQEVA
jgi:transposase